MLACPWSSRLHRSSRSVRGSAGAKAQSPRSGRFWSFSPSVIERTRPPAVDAFWWRAGDLRAPLGGALFVAEVFLPTDGPGICSRRPGDDFVNHGAVFARIRAGLAFNTPRDLPSRISRVALLHCLRRGSARLSGMSTSSSTGCGTRSSGVCRCPESSSPPSAA